MNTLIEEDILAIKIHVSLKLLFSKLNVGEKQDMCHLSIRHLTMKLQFFFPLFSSSTYLFFLFKVEAKITLLFRVYKQVYGSNFFIVQENYIIFNEIQIHEFLDLLN